MKRLFCLMLFCVVFHSFSQPQRSDFKLPEFADSITWSKSKLEKIENFLSKHLTKAFRVYHRDSLVFSYGKTDLPYHIFSARKSILSLLYGIYIEKGMIDPQATLSDLGIDDKQGLTNLEKEARIIDLLRARSGVYHVAAFETQGMENNRPERGSYQPDEHWYYNNWDFNALTTIFEQQVGMTVFQAFQESIASQAGMAFDPEIQQYHKEDLSIHPATLWYLSAGDLLILGRILLQEGKWEGKQLIPQKWIKESTKPYSNCGSLGGYGYCWWAADEGFHYPFVRLPEGTFSARGTGEQNLTIIPEWDMVIVHLTEVNSPEDEMMHVTDIGKLYMMVFDQKWY